MIYTGADLIRTSGQQAVRAENIARKVSAVEPAPSGTQEDSQGALLRFAKFIKKEHQRRPRQSPSKHPYLKLRSEAQKHTDVGQLLDIYA